jgi:Protein of unknown function (DUF3096)
MVITATELSPLVAILAGILILIVPRLLNYIVALYLIFFGLVQLNQTHRWVHLGMANSLPAIAAAVSPAPPRA